MSTREQFLAMKNLGSAVGATDPSIVVAVKDSSGNAATLNLDGSGNLKTTGGGGGSDATAANQVTGNTRLGDVTETAPITDIASSGLNGRLQRIAQRVTSLIALFPTTIGQKAKAASMAVTLASDEDLLAINGAVTETAPATDTASSGLNGRLQRIAQRITSLITLVPGSLGQKAKTASFAVTLASDDDLLAKIGEVQASPTANTVLDRLKTIASGLVLGAGSAIVGKFGIDQTAPGTSDRATVGKTAFIDVTLSLDTSAYASGDLLADTQIITNMTRIADLGCVLQSITVIDEDDQGAAFDIYFLDANNSFGSENSAPTITDANARNILGKVSVLTSDYTDLGGVKIASFTNAGLALQPVTGSRNGYVAVVNGTGTPTYSAAGVRLRLGLLQD